MSSSGRPAACCAGRPSRWRSPCPLASRDVAATTGTPREHLEVGVQLPAAVLASGEAGLRDLRQLPQACHPPPWACGPALSALGQPRANREAVPAVPERSPRAAQGQRLVALRKASPARLPSSRAFSGPAAGGWPCQIAQRLQGRIEKCQQDQAADVIVVELAIAGPIPLASFFSKTSKKRHETLERTRLPPAANSTKTGQAKPSIHPAQIDPQLHYHKVVAQSWVSQQ